MLRKFELMCALLKLYQRTSLKNATYIGIGSITDHYSRKDRAYTCRTDSRTREITGKQMKSFLF